MSEDERRGPARIVAATDFSHPGAVAMSQAIELAALHHAELSIVHVFAPPVPLVTAYEFGIPEPDLERGRRSAQEQLEECARRAAEAGVRAQIRLLDGPTDKAIVDFAREARADWLVVGTHGHTGLKHILLGSIAERVLRHAPCTVLVVRDAEGRADG